MSREIAFKEFHFHVYFSPNDPEEVQAATLLRDKINVARNSGRFVVELGRQLHQPVGPHNGGTFQIWVPQEFFVPVYSFLCHHRGDLSVLIHPVGLHEVEDHTRHALWLGESFKVNTSALKDYAIAEPEAAFRHHKLGYSTSKI